MPSVFAVSMVVAIWSPRAAMYMWLLVVAVRVIGDPIIDRLVSAGRERD
jgi:hypothetical protein